MGKKKLLITGANGCVGYEIVNQLHHVYDIVAVDRSFSNLQAFFENIKCVNADICDIESISKEFEGIDYVIHLAAKVHEMAKTEEDIRQFNLINTISTEKLFKMCIEYGIKKVLFFSTIAVYGSTEGLINESTAVSPTTPYAESKYRAEQIGMKMYVEKALPLFIIRPATIYGSLDRGNYRQLISLCKKGINIIPGKGDNYKPVIYVKDVARIAARILSEELTPGDTFIISQRSYMYKEILQCIKEAYGIKPINIHIPLFLIDLLNKCHRMSIVRKLKTLSESITIDNNKMLNVLRYKPEYDFLSGLIDSKEYYNR
jgi:nucleoside-diphosphate-sugar epimerase